MKETELRIGNWVLGASREKPQQITAFMLLHFEKLNLKPIPLTPEILAKVGFKFADYLNTKTRFSKSNFHIDFSKKMWFLHGYRGYPIGMKHLHQLQNLYFALSGEELNIDL
jgi:hypothetical protein